MEDSIAMAKKLGAELQESENSAEQALLKTYLIRYSQKRENAES